MLRYKFCPAQRYLFVGCLAAALTASPAHALQPLEAFVAAAQKQAPDNQEAIANLARLKADATSALGKFLPSLNLRGVYTRNQAQFIRPLTPGDPPSRLQLYNQYDGFATLRVPLVDLSSSLAYAAARANLASTQAQRAATALTVSANVAQLYYKLLADMVLQRAFERSLEVARASLALTRDRHAAGNVTALDVDRAEAEVERQEQQRLTAELEVILTARGLDSSSGLSPDLEQEAVLAVDSMTEVAPLAAWQRPDQSLPSLAAVIATQKGLERSVLSRQLALVPTLTAEVTERFTNLTGFTGRTFFYQGLLTLNWTLDLQTVGALHQAEANAAVGRARESRARLAARDAIHRCWQMVRSNIARYRSAQAQSRVSTRAAERAQDRYQAGAATQLDWLQAQRDAFQATANAIQAGADLANARVQLRLAAGLETLDQREESAS